MWVCERQATRHFQSVMTAPFCTNVKVFGTLPGLSTKSLAPTAEQSTKLHGCDGDPSRPDEQKYVGSGRVMAAVPIRFVGPAEL